jgi:hypothetical protein
VAVFGSVETASGTAGLRDLSPADLPAIVDYWLLSPDEYLAFRGVDRPRLGSADDTRRRFLNAIRTGDRSQRSISLGITLREEFIGYTLLNRYSEDANHSPRYCAQLACKGSLDSSLSQPDQGLF